MSRFRDWLNAPDSNGSSRGAWIIVYMTSISIAMTLQYVDCTRNWLDHAFAEMQKSEVERRRMEVEAAILYDCVNRLNLVTQATCQQLIDGHQHDKLIAELVKEQQRPPWKFWKFLDDGR